MERNCGGRKMGDARIDPAGGIRDVGTVHRNLVTNKKVLRHVCLNPFTKLTLILHGPLTAIHLPNLVRRLFK